MADGKSQRGGRVLFWGITWNILIAGVVSFLMDVSSEMVYAVTPLFLLSLGASATVIGTIEGLAEATAAIFKFLSGFLADRFGRYKPFVTAGYLISALSRPVLATAGGWQQVLAARISDRFGKGVRTASRDAIIAASAERGSLGKAFGIHRAMDQAGAILGPVIAFLILVATVGAYKKVFWASLVPGLLAVVATLFLVETGRKKRLSRAEASEGDDAEKTSPDAPADLHEDHSRHDAKCYWYFLAVMFVFSIGNSSNAFLFLRAKDLGVTLFMVPLCYALMNVVYTAASVPWGVLADRVGFKRVILVGFGVFSLVYLFLALANSAWMVWVFFALYGLFESAFEGQSRAYLARIAKAHLRGTSFGLYHMLLAATILPASVIAGFLWSRVSPAAPFYYGAIMSGVAFIMLAAEPYILGKEYAHSA